MVRALQKRFVLVAMLAVGLLLLVLLGSINFINIVSISRQNGQVLEHLVQEQLPVWHGDGTETEPPEEIFLQPPTEDSRKSAVFFAVWTDPQGEILEVRLERAKDLDEATARQMAQKVIAADKTRGFSGMYRYQKGSTAEGNYSVYVFLDLTVQYYDAFRLLVLSLLGGLVGLVLMLGVVILLSRGAIAPMAKSVQKQRQFITDAGHELKTPLAIMQSNLDALELLQGQSKWTGNIRQQIRRLDGLMQELLTLARLEERGALRKEPVDLTALVRQSLQMFDEQFRQRQVRLVCELEPVQVNSDPEQLARLLSILLDNAAKYVSTGGEAAVYLTGGKGAVLRLENTCDHLDQVQAEHLFDRFYRADAARSQSGGYGIGLSAAQAIVTALQGSISAEYPAPDRIAFTVKLG